MFHCATRCLSQTARFPATWLLPLLLLGGAGCGGGTEIRSYVVEREGGAVLTSDVVRREFPTIPLRWQVPKSWQSAENDQFSRIAWSAGPAAREARITISDLPASAGVEPQVARWRTQIGLPEAAPSDLMKSAETRTLGQSTGTWVDLQGSQDTILGMIIPYEDKLWIVKYRSANATATDERSAFRSFCESLTVVEPGRS